MTKVRKILAFLAVASIVLVGIYSTTMLLTQNKTSFSLAQGVDTATIKDTANSSELIAIGVPTGNVEFIKYERSLAFRLVEVKLTEVHSSDKKAGDIIKVLQTVDFAGDVVFDNESEYLLFLSPYKPGIKEAIGSYVTTNAFKGVYQYHEGSLTAIRTEYETPDQTAKREKDAISHFKDYR